MIFLSCGVLRIRVNYTIIGLRVRETVAPKGKKL
jgi:hypothetical protein